MEKKNPIKVAITGGIGSGKTTFADFFVDTGYFVIKTDILAKRIMVQDDKVKEKIILEFGEDVYKKDGDLDRTLLYQRAFSDEIKLKKLNKIVHPAVIEEMNNYFEQLKDDEINFVESALIFEANIENLFDYIILITSDEKLKLKRAADRDKISIADVEQRMRFQLSDEHKRKKVHFIFENNGTIDELKLKAKLLLNLIGIDALSNEN